jgi:3-isopropylmalate/(R)-2-methylmalate dehydratase small subunit
MSIKPIKSHKGIIALLDRANVDTDQIIPKQFLKSIAKTGFGKNLFYDWRYFDGKPNPEFILNQKRFKNTSVLVTRNNFGCGSSREHAVWAIAEYGFRVLVAPSQIRGSNPVPAFADIFRNNCSKNGILTIELSEAEVEEIFQMTNRYEGLQATADVDEARITLHLPEEISFHFEIDPAVKNRLIHGLDDIAMTLKEEMTISEFEANHIEFGGTYQ